MAAETSLCHSTFLGGLGTNGGRMGKRVEEGEMRKN